MKTRGLWVAAVGALGLLAVPASARANSNVEASLPRFAPLVFYVARATGGCGEGCDEWIAAEGGFDLGSADRLRAFLRKFPGRTPPIYFQSPGGIQEEAIAIGRLMHARGMTAGVARTLPFGCAPGKENGERCLALKRSGQPVAAELRSTGASCSSACVYALLGARIRLVPPDARLGVHASRRVHVYPDGRVTRTGDDGRLAEATSELNAVSEKAAELHITRLAGFAAVNLAWAQLSGGDRQAATVTARRAADLLAASRAWETESARALAAACEAERANAMLQGLHLAVSASHGNPDLYQPSDKILANLAKPHQVMRLQTGA